MARKANKSKAQAKGLKVALAGKAGTILADCPVSIGIKSLDLENPAAGFSASGNAKVAESNWAILPTGGALPEGKCLKAKIVFVVCDDKSGGAS